MPGRLLASDAEADVAEIAAELETEIVRLRERVTVLEDVLRSVQGALPMIGADPDVARAVGEEIERAIAGVPGAPV
jgi:hypothetical protein